MGGIVSTVIVRETLWMARQRTQRERQRDRERGRERKREREKDRSHEEVRYQHYFGQVPTARGPTPPTLQGSKPSSCKYMGRLEGLWSLGHFGRSFVGSSFCY